MSGIIQSVGGMVGAGMQGLKELAEGYMSPPDDSDEPSSISSSSMPGSLRTDPSPPPPAPYQIPTSSQPVAIPAAGSSSSSSSHSTSSVASKPSLPAQESLIRVLDVQSGWIHLQNAYLDGDGGGKKVRSFGVRNMADREVRVRVESDLGAQVLFWLGDDDKASSSSASSASSSSHSIGTTSLDLTLPPRSTRTIHLAFQPAPQSQLDMSPHTTPRLMPSLTRTTTKDTSASDLSPIAGSSPLPSSSGESSQSVAGSYKTSSAPPARKLDPIHRSFPVHGLLTLHATTCAPLSSDQTLTLPFFATVCRSLFTAAQIDPSSGLASGPQHSSGTMTVDFGPDCIVGQTYHRDVLLVNRSEIELVWTTAVVNSRFKDNVWFSLRDLDSENVFGVDASAQPVPLPALSSRHLRLELRVKSPVQNFDFDFVLSNLNASGNTITCRAVGSGVAEEAESKLKILSGTILDFGNVVDGMWARGMVTVRNAGDRPLDVRMGAEKGWEVGFRLAGVAGEDLEEEAADVKMRDKGDRVTVEPLARVTTRDSRGRSEGGELGDTSRSVAETDSSHWEKSSSSTRDRSLPPSRALSRIHSHSSSYRYESDDEDGNDDPFFNAPQPSTTAIAPPALRLAVDDKIPDLIEELTMRPGTEYRILVLYRPSRDTASPADVAGKLRPSSFKVHLDASTATGSSKAMSTRRTITCTAQSCTSLISLTPPLLDFGEVTVGASRTATFSITNLSALSARVEIAAISKVLSANRNVIVIPPFESVEEKIEFFPRRINERYEKQVRVRNWLNRENDQVLQIRSRNVDTYNLTLHSLLYRILTPSGSNFLDFGNVVINSPALRTVHFENLTQAPLSLELSASQSEDVELYVKVEDAILAGPKKLDGVAHKARYGDESEGKAKEGKGEMKERFMETLREIEARSDVGSKAKNGKSVKAKSKGKEREPSGEAADGDPGKNEAAGAKESKKGPVAVAVGHALKRGLRGRPVQLYGNSVVFKDRHLLTPFEALDLAAGPPVDAHRVSPRSKRTQVLDAIEVEDRRKLSGLQAKGAKLDFASGARERGLVGKEGREGKEGRKRTSSKGPMSPRLPSDTGEVNRELAIKTPPNEGKAVPPSLAGVIAQLPGIRYDRTKSPALTAKKADPARSAMFEPSDISSLSVDQLLLALEQHDAHKASIVAHSTLEDEEAFVRRTMALRKELANLISSGKLIPARTLRLDGGATKQVVVIMTPNGSIRPHVTTRAKRADSRVFIRLREFDKTYLPAGVGATESAVSLPVRDLLVRSSCVRTVLEVQQSSINFGGCEKGEIKKKTIVMQNKSDTLALFRLRLSGSIASGDLKLGLGRYGVIPAFARREVESFSFTPSLVGKFEETMVVENVLDRDEDQGVQVKANVRRVRAFAVEPEKVDLGVTDMTAKVTGRFTVTNLAKGEKTFVIRVEPASPDSALALPFAQVSLQRDEGDAGKALSKSEEEEVEGILQKLKIARRKGKADKISKYESRLRELGQPIPAREGGEPESTENGTTTPAIDQQEVVEEDEVPPAETPTPGTKGETELSVTLQPNQKGRIIVALSSTTGGTGPLDVKIKIHDRKNTDETAEVVISATPPVAMDKAGDASKGGDQSDALHTALMRHSLELTLRCDPVPTAFCVGSTLFLPSTSYLFPTISPHFPVFSDGAGLILGDGWSRQIPGNTHAEANALTDFRSEYAALKAKGLPEVGEVLKEAWCYATMEPCSVRTSGGPSCAVELVKAGVRRVFLGVEEPPDFVQCEGVRIMRDAGIDVRRVTGLEEDCLAAARRGRD